VHSTDPATPTATPSSGELRGSRSPARAHKALPVLAFVVVLPLAIIAALQIFHNPEAGAESMPIAGLESIAWPRSSNQPPPEPPRASETTAVASVDSMILGLEQRLAREPGDAKGWALLAQSYAFLGDARQAEAALAKAAELGFDEQDLRRRLNLAAKEPTESGGRKLLADAVVIHGMVKLASATPLELAPDSRLFVTAKATDGSTVPVAVLGQRVTEFPYQFVLSDADAMMPGVKLSSFAEIALSARLSQLGTTARNDGDLESPVKIVRLGEPGWVDLVIENR